MIRCLAFSDRGMELARRIAGALGGSAFRSGDPLRGAEWTKKYFSRSEALIFVGSCGIAVRMTAPLLRSKAEDPAVVVIDERGRFVIPVLSGHLGGANDLARRIAGLTGGTAVLTTATDVTGTFAVDSWARIHNASVLNPRRILPFSRKLLSGASAVLASRFPFQGTAPAGIRLTGMESEDGNEDPDSVPDAVLDYGFLPGFPPAGGNVRGAEPLLLVPRVLTLGIGCRRGVSAEQIEEQYRKFLEHTGFREEAFRLAASIDLKQGERGLLAFCQRHHLKACFYSPDRLRQVTGVRSSSDFVKEVTGVDNVCERAAVLAASSGAGPGELIAEKFPGNGVTLAAAAMHYAPDWRDHE